MGLGAPRQPLDKRDEARPRELASQSPHNAVSYRSVDCKSATNGAESESRRPYFASSRSRAARSATRRHRHRTDHTRRDPSLPCPRPATMLRPSSRTEARKKGFKKATDADEARRKREEGMIQIRKDKREEAMLKKRR